MVARAVSVDDWTSAQTRFPQRHQDAIEAFGDRLTPQRSETTSGSVEAKEEEAYEQTATNYVDTADIDILPMDLSPLELLPAPSIGAGQNAPSVPPLPLPYVVGCGVSALGLGTTVSLLLSFMTQDVMQHTWPPLYLGTFCCLGWLVTSIVGMWEATR